MVKCRSPLVSSPCGAPREYVSRSGGTFGCGKRKGIVAVVPVAALRSPHEGHDSAHVAVPCRHLEECNTMESTAYVAALEANLTAIAALVRAMPTDAVRWRPTADDWSVLEVINHLADEEREDFRTRLAFVLSPGDDIPPLNRPAAWVIERAYNERDPDESLARFERERRQSLVWLRGLATPDWTRAWEAASGYTLRAGDLLASWAAHDLLHLRQLVELQYYYRAHQAAPFSVTYAGEW